MANTERFRRTPQQSEVLIEVPVASATVIEKGDIVLLWDGKAIQPSDLGSIYDTELAARAEGARMFLGIAWDPSPAGSTHDIRVDICIDSIYEYPQCDAAAASIADLYGICAASTAASEWALSDQAIEPDCSYPIMQCVREKTATGTSLLVKMYQNHFYNRPPSWAMDTCHTDSDKSYAG